MTEAEAADWLRCSRATVKKLRLTGKLAYTPGRPPLIQEADLLRYLETQKRTGRPEPLPLTDPVAARAWARAIVMKPKRASRQPAPPRR